MGLGFGYMADSAKIEGVSNPGAVDATGGAFTLEVDVGGAVSPGIILAGSYTIHSVGDAKLRNDTRLDRPARDPALTMLAAMVDVYPNPRAGFHVGGSLGLASLRVHAEEDRLASSGGQTGWGVAPHVGYEWWVSSYWGLGALARLVYARTRGDYANGTASDGIVAGTLLFTATYN